MTDEEIRKGNRYALVGVIITVGIFILTIFVKAIITVYSTQERVSAVEKRTDVQDKEIQTIREDIKQLLLRDQPK